MTSLDDDDDNGGSDFLDSNGVVLHDILEEKIFLLSGGCAMHVRGC